MKSYLKLIRTQHYIKNLLIFAALAFSRQFFDVEKLLDCIIAFVAFCAISSAVYIINDIRDREKDRCHPTKCNRPIAAGKVSVRRAVILTIILLIIAAICNALVFSIVATLWLAAYLILNLAYSFGAKNIPIFDVVILGSGFMIRVLYGAAITDIALSSWLYLTVIVTSFYFTFGKRRNEIKQVQGTETRTVLNSYPISFLDKSMTMCLTLANGFYALWSVDTNNVAMYGQKLVLTVPLVLLITIKYSLTVEGESDGDPVSVLLKDKILLALCAIYCVLIFVIIYFGKNI